MKKEPKNTLIIGDLHIPFENEKYLQHCIDIKKKYHSTRTIFIGDIQDNHAASYWESNPDGYSAGDELTIVKKRLNAWKQAFKNDDVFVCIGNHDAVPQRKLFSAGVSSKWLKNFAEVFNTPHWQYGLNWTFDGVYYSHGLGCSNLRSTILNKRMNVVYGHFHTKFEIMYNASEKDLLWGMIVGCGIDIKKYAFEYARNFSQRPIIGCGIVTKEGQPILEPMKL